MLRVYARRKASVQLWWDDWLIVVAMVRISVAPPANISVASLLSFISGIGDGVGAHVRDLFVPFLGLPR